MHMQHPPTVFLTNCLILFMEQHVREYLKATWSCGHGDSVIIKWDQIMCNLTVILQNDFFPFHKLWNYESVVIDSGVIE